MTNRIRTRIFLLVILVGSGLGVKAQSWDWKYAIPRITPVGSMKPHQGVEFFDILPASGGQVYLCGVFWGKKVQFGTHTAWADTNLIARFAPHLDTMILDASRGFQTPFLACQNASGEFIWVKTLSGSSDAFYGDPRSRPYLRRLAVGPDGSVYAAGVCTGDSVVYNGTPVFRQASSGFSFMRRHLVVLKAQSNGDLVWAKSYSQPVTTNQNGPAHLIADPRNLEFGPSGLELALNYFGATNFGVDSLVGAGSARLRFSPEGDILDARLQASSGPPVGWTGLHPGRTHLLNRQLKDHRRVIGKTIESPGSTPEPSSEIEVFNSELSSLLFRYTFRIRSLSTEVLTFPQEIWELPDGKMGILLGMVLDPSAVTQQSPYTLMVNSDSLDITPLVQGGGTKTLFLKFSEGACLKDVESFDFFVSGVNNLTPNGNLLVANPEVSIWGQVPSPNGTSTRIFSVTRNGETSEIVNLDEWIFPSPVLADWNDWVANQNFQIRTAPTGNKAWICAGNFVGQFTYPDPVLGDESATGCLRGNAITATREIQKQDLFLSQSQNGVEIRATDNQSGRYRILSSDGRLVEEGSWKGSQTPIGRSIGAKGIYQVVLSGSGNHKTLRFVQF